MLDTSTFPFPVIISGELRQFSGEYIRGDFWRQNPDGTVSVKLASNQAEGYYYNLGTGEEYIGTGHLTQNSLV